MVPEGRALADSLLQVHRHVHLLAAGNKTQLKLASARKGIHWVMRASPVVLVVRNPPAKQEMQETRVRSPGWEDPLEKGMATHSSILAWIIPRTEEPGGLQSLGSQRVGHD